MITQEMQEWEIKFRALMDKIPIAGWSSDKEQLVTFFKHNYHVLDNNDTYYDSRYVDNLAASLSKAIEAIGIPQPTIEQEGESAEGIGVQYGESATADFEENTWTFVMPDTFEVTAGKFAIIPAMHSYASQSGNLQPPTDKQECFVWVKASDRPPVNGETVVVKYGNYYTESTCVNGIWFKPGTNVLFSTNHDNIEWLSPAPLPNGFTREDMEACWDAAMEFTSMPFNFPDKTQFLNTLKR